MKTLILANKILKTLQSVPLKSCDIDMKVQKSRENHLWDHVLKGVHDPGALGVLVVGKACTDDDHKCKHDTQVQLQ